LLAIFLAIFFTILLAILFAILLAIFFTTLIESYNRSIRPVMVKDAWPGARRQHAGLPYLAGTCVTDKQRSISFSCLSLWESLARLVNAKQFVIGELSGVGEDGACTGRSISRSRDSCMDRLG
jgi:hypothetical protein